MVPVNTARSVSSDVPSRRERVHESTKTELVSAARALLVERGVTEVTVRAVAAAVGMTGPAMYRYYGSREALLDDVVDVLYDELADHLERAVAAARTASLTVRFVAAASSFREWALANRPEFGVLFGAPIPGIGGGPHDTDPTSPDPWHPDARGMRFMLVWLQLFREIGSTGIDIGPWPRPVPPGLRAQLEAFTARLDQPVSVDLAMLFLVCWQNLYGFICTETFGHLGFALHDGTDMFTDRLAELRDLLHLP